LVSQANWLSVIQSMLYGNKKVADTRLAPTPNRAS